MTDLDHDWHDNDGTVPPNLRPTDRVLVRFRDGLESAPRIVSGLRWSFNQIGDDVVAYRFFARYDDEAQP